MSEPKLRPPRERWHLPILGQRIVKTTVAVLICLIVYVLRGHRGQNMPTEAGITAIICLQPYLRDTRDFSLNRMAGTLIGGFWGLLFLLLMDRVPPLGINLFLLYPLMAAGVMISLYTTVLFRLPDASSLAAIVFLCVVIAFPEIEEPLQQAADRILGVLLGTFAAISVNLFRLPRAKNRDCVFFVRTRDLVPDRFSQIPSAALFHLRRLIDDGARICLISEHAPAFFTAQMNQALPSVPLIVMDGAAIYDARENEILSSVNLRPEDSVALRRFLDGRSLSYFIYTVHKGRTCIFHHGRPTGEEQPVLEHMRRSPYRSYLEGEIYDQKEIVYFKLIDREARALELAQELEPLLVKRGLRCVLRPQAGGEDLIGLYVYAQNATVAHTQEKLMAMLREKEPELRSEEVFLRDGYRSEYDAMQLLHTLSREYEPVRLFRRKQKKE